MQSDDVQLHGNQTQCLRTYLLTNGLVPKHKLRTSRILHAISKGRGMLTASLAYYGSNYETKEVLLNHINFILPHNILHLYLNL